MKKLLILFSLIILSGCETEIEVPIKLSDFDKNERSIQVIGDMALEVTSCNKSGSSEMPSDDIFKLQTKIPYVFKGAKYISCEKIDYNSFAFFKVPVNIDNEKNEKVVDENVLNVSFFESTNNERSLVVAIHPKLQNSIKELISSDIYAKVDSMSITLAIDPEGQKFSFMAYGIYLDGTPVQVNSFTNNGEKFKVKIPTYGIKHLLSNDLKEKGVISSFTILVKTSTEKLTPKQKEIKEADKQNASFVRSVFDDTEVIWGKIFEQAGQRYPKPELFIYQGETQTVCGITNPKLSPFYCHIDRKVYVDLDFVREFNIGDKTINEYTLAYLITHEIGHHIQNIEGTLDKVHKAKQSIKDTEGDALQLKVELQADCYAGIWANYKKEKYNKLNTNDITKALTSVTKISNSDIQKQTDSFNIPHNMKKGNSEQRSTWLAHGSSKGMIQDCQTFR